MIKEQPSLHFVVVVGGRSGEWPCCGFLEPEEDEVIRRKACVVMPGEMWLQESHGDRD